MELYKIWLSIVFGARVRNGLDILNSGISPEELYQNRKSWHKYGCFTAKQMERALSVPIETAQQILIQHEKLNIQSVYVTEENYPESFTQIPDCPIVLFYKGDITLLNAENIVAAVGARNPDRDGVKICGDIVAPLAGEGVVIVSGLAQGLDGIAHKTALEQKGKTVAFVGTALDKVYPAAHRQMAKQIEETGCVVSEYYVGCPTPPAAFLERNRLIAAASKCVCVIQAKEKSGSLATAKNAVEYSKHLFAVPGTITNEMYDGTNRLIQDGATPLISAKDILSFLGIETTVKKAKAKTKAKKLTDTEQIIYTCIGRATKSTNQIFKETRIPMVQLKALLSKLEMEGVISSASPGVFYIK